MCPCYILWIDVKTILSVYASVFVLWFGILFLKPDWKCIKAIFKNINQKF